MILCLNRNKQQVVSLEYNKIHIFSVGTYFNCALGGKFSIETYFLKGMDP